MKVSRNGLVGSIDKSRRFRRIVGLRSHCIRPTESLKPDCKCPLQRKAGRLTPFDPDSQFSPVRFADEILRNTGMFCVFRGKSQGRFSAAKTGWRSAQSGANSSPPEFPANREKYREFAVILLSKMHSSFSKLHILREKVHVQLKSEQGPNRELTGGYQGIYFCIRDLLQNGLGWTRILRKPKLLTLLRPTQRDVFIQMLEL
jgi:hypothetical protein